MKYCRSCGSDKLKTNQHCDYCSTRNSIKFKNQRELHRKRILKHYSKTDPPSCECCKESNPLFLTIDHIDSIGLKEKRKQKTSTYSEIVKAGFPPGLRILCMNCNHGRMRNGGICPHEKILPIPEVPPQKRLKNHYPSKKPFWIMKQRDKYVLQINDDAGMGRIYAGIYKTKKDAIESALKNWGLSE